jgi:predicted lactoylglutathione lyase
MAATSRKLFVNLAVEDLDRSFEFWMDSSALEQEAPGGDRLS